MERWKQSRCRSTVQAFTGLGKTAIAVFAIRRVLNAIPEAYVLVVVPSAPVAKQWKRDIAVCCSPFERVEVVTMDTAARHSAEYKCDLLVIDEIHQIPTKKRMDVLRIRYRMILGLTATYERLDGKHKILERYAPISDDITLAEGIRNGWTSDHVVYVVLCDIEDRNKYNEMTDKFKKIFEWFDHKFEDPFLILEDKQFRSSYVHNMVVPRMAIEEGVDIARLNAKQLESMYAAGTQTALANSSRFIKLMTERKRFLWHHPKKLEIAEKILAAYKGQKGITFWSTIEDAEKVSVGKVYASASTESGRTEKQNKEVLDWFFSTDGAVVNTVRALNIGFDCPEITFGIIAGFNSSKTDSKQKIGRAIRINKMLREKKADVFYIVIRQTNDEHWAAKALSDTNYVIMQEEDLDAFLEGKHVEFMPGKLRTGSRY